MIKMLPQVIENPAEVVLFGGGEGLAPLRISHLTSTRALPFHIFTAVDRVPGEFVLTWRRGSTLPEQAREMVWGYFAVSEAGEVLTHLLSRVEETLAQGEPGYLDLLKLMADTLLVWVQHFFCHEAVRTPEGLAGAQGLITSVAQGLHASENVLETVGRLRRHDSGLFSHCLNVTLLGLASFPSLTGDRDEGETFALGTLLHDLGMMPRAQETFQQTGPLSDQEWEEIKGHPARGAKLLRALEQVPEEVLVMIRQHHESTDGSGYPEGLKGGDIHPWARVLRILDSYEAITSLRPWRPPLSERQALRLMKSAWSTQGGYDREYLELFLAFCQGK